jgi:hypothetical protein
MTVVSRQWPVVRVRKNIGEKSIRQFIFFWLLATVFLRTAGIAEAEQPKKIPRIGYLSGGGARIDAFRPGAARACIRGGEKHYH